MSVCLISGNKQTNSDEAYRAYVRNVAELQAINALPVPVAFEESDVYDEELLVQNLVVNKAVWHKSCQLKFTTSKVCEAKRKFQSQRNSEDARESNLRRKQPKRTVLDKGTCVFCENGPNSQIICKSFAL